MIGFGIQTIFFLAGFIILLVSIIRRIRRRTTPWIPGTLAGIALMVVSVWMGYWKIYQCKFAPPDEIRITGHVRDVANFYLNNHMVIAYRAGEEQGRTVTGLGKFSGDTEDEENNGYFELDIPNTDQLTRCSMAENFRQDGSGYGLLGFGNRVTYLLHDFDDIQPGWRLRLNTGGQKIDYSLQVLPVGQENLPMELYQYRTYINQNGKVTINAPIKIYTMQGGSAVEYITSYFVHLPPGMNPTGSEVRNAWVQADGTPQETPGRVIADNDGIDVDNCRGLSPIQRTQVKKLSFMREVQFETTVNPTFDLGMAAFKASPSMGFTQGEIVTSDAQVNIYVPPGAHKVYKVSWPVFWRAGTIQVDTGQTTYGLPVRMSNIKEPDIQEFDVDCP